ncbi:MAG TPA: YfiR family protein [Candidatus Acidoferrales bacterium]|jgi:hypothetical protein|nr:YfiR family protein [Candidatus Acidoferrales bacterium]
MASEANISARRGTPPVWRMARFLTGGVLALILVAAGAGAGSVLRAWAQSEPPPEYQIKAAFLYNFAKFVEWPADAFADPHAPLVLGIVGEDPFGSVLDKLVLDKTVNGRGLLIKRLKHGPDLRNCHILFVSSSERKRVAQILESLQGASVLTVGETQRFAQSGGVIDFILEENKVRFEINSDAAARARLNISSKLLALARIVTDQLHGAKN